MLLARSFRSTATIGFSAWLFDRHAEFVGLFGFVGRCVVQYIFGSWESASLRRGRSVVLCCRFRHRSFLCRESRILCLNGTFSMSTEPKQNQSRYAVQAFALDQCHCPVPTETRHPQAILAVVRHADSSAKLTITYLSTQTSPAAFPITISIRRCVLARDSHLARAPF